MTITFYKITDEKNSFPKNLNVDRKLTMTGTLRDNDTSIISPEITFSGDITNFDYNYAYIEEFHRYYFIDEIVSEYSEIFNITFEEDYLQSWANDILEQTAFVERCEDLNHANFRITDNNILVYPQKYTYAPVQLEPIHYTLSVSNNMISDFSIDKSNHTNYFNTVYSENIIDEESSSHRITEKGYILLTVNVADGFWTGKKAPYDVESIYPVSPRLFFNNYTQAPGSSVTYIFTLYNFQRFATAVMNLEPIGKPNDFREALNGSFLSLYYVPFDIVTPLNAQRIGDVIEGPQNLYSIEIWAGNKTHTYYGTTTYIVSNLNTAQVNAPIMAFDVDISYFKELKTDTLKPQLNIYQDFRAMSNITEWSINLPFFDSYNFDPLEWISFDYVHVRYFYNIITSYMTCIIVGGIEPKRPQQPQYETLLYKQEKTVGENLTLSLGGSDSTQRLLMQMLKTGSEAIITMLGAPEWVSVTNQTVTPRVHTNTFNTRKTARNKSTGRQITMANKTVTNTDLTSGGERKSESTTSRGTGTVSRELIDGIGNAISQSAPQRNISSSNNPGAYNSTNECTIIRIEKVHEFPQNYANLIGYICNNSDVLKNFKGYVKVGKVHLNIPALSSELEAIEDLLQSGVIINEISE